MRWTTIGLILLCMGRTALAVEMTSGGLKLSVDEKGTVALTDTATGWGLSDGRLVMDWGGMPVGVAVSSVSVHGEEAVIAGRVADVPVSVALRLAASADGLDQLLIAELPDPIPAGDSVLLRGSVQWGGSALLCRLKPGAADDVLQLATGPTASGRLNALFDAASDNGLFLQGQIERLEPVRQVDPSEGFKAQCGGPRGFTIGVRRGVFRKGLGVRYYAPLDRSVFKLPPTGWLSWYDYGWGGITEAEMKKNADWMAAHLKPFGAEYILMDAGYSGAVWEKWDAKRFPSGGKALADMIKAAGMRPALWITPFSTSDKQLVDAHPDWFLRDAKGGTIETFIGKYTIDATNPEVLDKWLKPLFTTFNDWGYVYYKLDGQTTVEDAYKANAQRFFARTKLGKDVEPLDAYRLGLQAIRDAVGPERFVTSCWGIALGGVGITNGSRSGGDVEATWEGIRPAIEGTRRWLCMNNICWMTDPDCVLVRPPLTLDQARSWASFVGITGQQVIASDRMYDLPEERVDVLRRILPVCYMQPLDLYHLNARQAATIDLRVEKPFDRWDVVGLFYRWRNETGSSAEVAPARLGLSSSERDRYLGYDFWEGKFVAPFLGELKLDMRPSSCHVLALHGLEDRPQLLSTSRHITQGAVDLSALAWDEDSLTLSGTSSLVGADPYELRISAPPEPEKWRALAAKADAADGGKVSTSMKQDGPWVRVTVKTDSSREVAWSVSFAKEPGQPAELKAVAGLAAEALSDREVRLRWTPADEGALSYRVSRAPGGLPFVVMEPGFLDTDLSPDTEYAYDVGALDWAGKEGPTATISVRTLPAPAAPPLPGVYISDLKPVKAPTTGSQRPHVNKSLQDNALRVAGKQYEHGVGVQARSELVYDLKPEYVRFVAVAGVDDEVNGNPSAGIVFRVYADGTLLRETRVFRAGERAVIDLPIPAGTKQLKLGVADGGDDAAYDHADWADAGFVLK